MGGRAYDPELGRFLSVDPFISAPTNSQALNPYSYVMNNPLAYTDPTGYCAAETGSHIKSCAKIETKGADGKTLNVRRENTRNGDAQRAFAGAAARLVGGMLNGSRSGASSTKVEQNKDPARTLEQKGSTNQRIGAEPTADASQTGDISTALDHARNDVAKTLGILQGKDQSAAEQLMYEWYADMSSKLKGDLITRLKHIDKILAGWQKDPSRMTIDMDYAGKDEYGHVPDVDDRNHRVVLGAYFMRAAVSGRDSKASTLIHEASHFNVYVNGKNVLAGTEDRGVGIDGARTLAEWSRLEARKTSNRGVRDSAAINSYTLEFFTTGVRASSTYD